MRVLRKEITAAERRMEKLAAQVERLHARMAAHDPNDYGGLSALGEELRALEAQVAEQEERWLELSEQVG